MKAWLMVSPGRNADCNCLAWPSEPGRSLSTVPSPVNRSWGRKDTLRSREQKTPAWSSVRQFGDARPGFEIATKDDAMNGLDLRSLGRIAVALVCALAIALPVAVAKPVTTTFKTATVTFTKVNAADPNATAV